MLMVKLPVPTLGLVKVGFLASPQGAAEVGRVTARLEEGVGPMTLPWESSTASA